MESEYELAYRVTGHILAESITALLKSFGIDAYLIQESAGITYGLTIGPLGEARIYVRTEQLEDAKHILDQMERGELQVEQDEKQDDKEENVNSGDGEA
jgi:hypothetical protein